MSIRIAIAHEWLVRYAGSERCVEEILEVFPHSELLTTIIRPEVVPPSLRNARPSLLQRLPGATSHHEWFVPLMPLAWRLQEPVRDVDLVISSSHACAKAVRTNGVPHLCYCHTPMRYAWDFDSERSRFPPAIRPVARAGMSWFRHWDRRTAARVTRFVANSSAVAARIARSYGRRAEVIHPPVRTDFFTPRPGSRTSDFLYVGRLVSYKRPDLVVDAFRELPEYRLLVVGEGPLERDLKARASKNVRFLRTVDDAGLRELYRSCRALVYPADEDFGITMAEAQACGTPVIGLAAGGAADIVDVEETGWLIARQSVDEVRLAVRRAAVAELDEAHIAARAQRFSAARFRREIRDAARACVEEQPEMSYPTATELSDR